MATWSEILSELQQLQQQVQQGQAELPPGQSVFDVTRRKYIQQLHRATDRNIIVYATKWTQGPVQDPESISITAEDVQGFMEVVHGLDRAAGLDLILHLPGGSAEVTEAIVKYLRGRFQTLRVFIPQAAMSAASMLSCAADVIVMGTHSSMGPIDPQFVLRTDVGAIVAPAHAILEQFELAQKQCQDPALLPSWIPILRQYGPSLIVQCKLATKLSKTLVKGWLAAYMLKGKPRAKSIAARIAGELARHPKYMSHARFISRDEAKKLGLVVQDLEADQAIQDAVLSIFHAVTLTFNATPAVKIIENQLGKAFVKMQQAIQMRVPTFIPAVPQPPIPGPVPAAPAPSQVKSR